MATHKAQHGRVGRRQKTVTTECGKRVPVSSIAVAVDTDCPACRARVDERIAAIDAIIEHHRSRGYDVSESLAERERRYPTRYQTTYFL